MDGATIGNVNNSETKAFDILNGWHIIHIVLGKRHSVSIVFHAYPDPAVEMEYSPVTGLSYPKQSEEEILENSQKVLALLESEKSSLELALQQPEKVWDLAV